MLAGFFITLASQDELRERLGRRVPQTGCHLDPLLDWGSPSRPSPVAGQGWQFENKCIFLDTWYLLLSGAHSNGKSWQSYFLRLINNFEVSSNRQIKPTMSSSFSSPLRDAVIVSYLTSHSSTTFSTSIQSESTSSLSLSNATRALIIGEWETQVQFVLTDHPNSSSQEHSTLHIACPSKDPLTPSSTLHSGEDEHLLQVVAISHWSVFLSQINKWKFVPLVRALVILCEIWAKILRCASSLISRGWSNIYDFLSCAFHNCFVTRAGVGVQS